MGGNCGVSSGDFSQRLKKVGCSNVWAGLSVKGGKGVYQFGRMPGWAVGLFYGWAEGFPRGPIRYFFLFFLFFSCFLIFFISFAFVIQIDSN
jgi:hypothetical protein